MIAAWLVAGAIAAAGSNAPREETIDYGAQGAAMAGLTPWRAQWFGAAISAGASVTDVDLFGRVDPALGDLTPWIAPWFGPGVAGVGPSVMTAQLSVSPGLPPVERDGSSTRAPAALDLLFFSGGNIAGWWRQDPVWGVGPGWLLEAGSGGSLWAVRDKRGALGLDRSLYAHLGGGGFLYYRFDDILLISLSGGVIPRWLSFDPTDLIRMGGYGLQVEGETSTLGGISADARIQIGPVSVFYDFRRSRFSDAGGELFDRDMHVLGLGAGVLAERW